MLSEMCMSFQVHVVLKLLDNDTVYVLKRRLRNNKTIIIIKCKLTSKMKEYVMWARNGMAEIFDNWTP